MKLTKKKTKKSLRIAQRSEFIVFLPVKIIKHLIYVRKKQRMNSKNANCLKRNLIASKHVWMKGNLNATEK